MPIFKNPPTQQNSAKLRSRGENIFRYPQTAELGLSPACYIQDAFPAALYLAWKYAKDFSGGIIANANLGGDNCHRGAVVGSLLGAANGVPPQWREGLLAVNP